jgi:hypothetical protein
VIIAFISGMAFVLIQSDSVQAATMSPIMAQTWDQDMHLPPGGYRTGKQINLTGNFKIDIDPGVFLDGVAFASSNAGQHFTAKGDFFRNVRIAGQLGVSLNAEDCVFENCQFSKGGGWFVDWWGSSWRFTNCVVTRQFLPAQINVNDYSVFAKDCSFYGVKMPSINAIAQCGYFQSDQLRFENCRFVGCTIPETSLAAAVNCTFEGCNFPAEHVVWPKKAQPIHVTAYFSGFSAPKSFVDGPLSVDFQPAPKTATAGCTLSFTENGGLVTLSTLRPPDQFTQIGILRTKKASDIQPQ